MTRRLGLVELQQVSRRIRHCYRERVTDIESVQELVFTVPIELVQWLGARDILTAEATRSSRIDMINNIQPSDSSHFINRIAMDKVQRRNS
jgi:hypothetical protein